MQQHDLNSYFALVKSNSVFLFIVLGFLAGLLSRILMPGRDPMGIIATTLLGIAGSFLGAYGAEYSGLVISASVPQFILSVAGSFALLLVIKFIRNV